MRDTEIDDRYDELAERWKEISDRRDRWEDLLELAENAMRKANNVSFDHAPLAGYCDEIWAAAKSAYDRATDELAKAEKDMATYDRDLKELEGPMEASYQKWANG
jgi:flagellar motility protein MotE (MotC chaperone)